MVLVDTQGVVLPAWPLFRYERKGQAIMANQASTYYLKLGLQPGMLRPWKNVVMVETLSRRYIDICGIQKHRGSVAWSNSPLDRKKLKVVQAFYCLNNGLIRYLKLSVYLSYCFKVDNWWGYIFLLFYICSSIWSIRDRTILQTTVSKMPVSESLIIVGDWNWHVCKIGIWLS